MNDLPFKFPILTIPRFNPEKPWEMVNIHFSWDWFTLQDRQERKDPRPVGRIVMDVTGRSWRVLGMRDLGMQADGPLDWFWCSLVGQHRVKWEISEELHLPFEDIRESVCALILADPDGWRDDEAVAGEGGLPPRDEQEMLDELVANVRDAKSPLELMAVTHFHGQR